MTNFEIAATAYSVVSTLGLALTAYYGRKFLLAIEQRLHARVSDEVKLATVYANREAFSLRAHVLGVGLAAENQAVAAHDSLKADIARVEKWITEHAEELKARAEDLRVRALDLHDKTQAGPTRQPPTRS